MGTFSSFLNDRIAGWAHSPSFFNDRIAGWALFSQRLDSRMGTILPKNEVYRAICHPEVYRAICHPEVHPGYTPYVLPWLYTLCTTLIIPTMVGRYPGYTTMVGRYPGYTTLYIHPGVYYLVYTPWDTHHPGYTSIPTYPVPAAEYTPLHRVRREETLAQI